ncbi:MAG: penicillin-binding protein 2 [Burkholderiaceae bacterium]
MKLSTRASLAQGQVFRQRILVAYILVLLCFGLLVARFVYLQVFKHDELSQLAQSNRTAQVPIEPARGWIMDRHEFVLARDNPGFALEIVPKEQEDLEQTIAKIQQIVPVSEADIKRFNRLRAESDPYDSIPIRAKLSEEEVARFSVQQFQFKGVSVAKRSFREYPNGDLAVHVIGYVGRVNQRDKERIKKNGLEQDYLGTTHIGKLGIEQSYESLLHGKNGYERLEVMASGRQVGVLGAKDPVQGNNLQLTIDAYLQDQVEKAFAGRRGSLVAIEPSTGQVLAFVSAPTYDPNLFVEGISQEKWDELNGSIQKPLFNRALRGAYPPGSTYKPFMALAALHSGARDRNAIIQDGGIYTLGTHRYRDSTGGRGHGAVNMFTSIAVSSDVYYYSLAHQMGVDLMHQEISRFGFGEKTGIDLVGEEPGILPSKEWFFKRTGREWSEGQTISLGIGQGENTFTILQLANATATIANNGVRMKPYLLKAKIDPLTGQRTETQPQVAADLQIPAADIDLIKRAMVQVNISGTGRGIFNGLPGGLPAGKTGTAQVFTVSQTSTYAQSMRGEFMRDHSLYIAFYPADKPQIAIAAIVENAGFGATAAAPLVRRTLDAFVASQNGQRMQLRGRNPTSAQTGSANASTGNAANQGQGQ